MKPTLRRDSLTGRSWLFFDGKPDQDVIDTLKKENWRWSGFRKAWHNNRKFCTPPHSIEYTVGEPVNFAEERSERLHEKSEKCEKEAQAMREAAGKHVEHIPFGQPILRGHHSEKRHRKDLEAFDRKFGKAVDIHKKAERLEARAEDSARHQDRKKNDRGLLTRRLERLWDNFRHIESNKEYYSDEEFELKAETIMREIKETETRLNDLPEMEPLQVQKGDIIIIHSFKVRVEKVNRKTIAGTLLDKGVEGMKGKWDKTYLRAVLERAGQE